jgi:hypothetical protein
MRFFVSLRMTKCAFFDFLLDTRSPNFIKERRCKIMMDIKKALEKEEQEKVEKRPFEEPKLQFIEPKLSKHGYLTDVTFVVPFSPLYLQ